MTGTYKMTFAAYDGPHRYFVTFVNDATGEQEAGCGFETRADAAMYLAEMNDTPEWQEYCRF